MYYTGLFTMHIIESHTILDMHAMCGYILCTHACHNVVYRSEEEQRKREKRERQRRHRKKKERQARKRSRRDKESSKNRKRKKRRKEEETERLVVQRERSCSD